MAGLGVSDWTPREGSPSKVANGKGLSDAPPKGQQSEKADRQRAAKRSNRRRSAPAGTRSENRSGSPDKTDKQSASKKTLALEDCKLSEAQTPAASQLPLDTIPELSRKHALSQLAGASRWLSAVFSHAADQLDEPTSPAPSAKPITFRAGGVKLTHWPPETGYCEAFDGWQRSDKSSEWLYKPSNGIYFHKPSETLWKRAWGDRMKFVRMDGASTGFEAMAIAAWGDSATGRIALLRACTLAWSQQLRKFEDMDRELSNFEEARMSMRPRMSPTRTADRGDRLTNLIRPAANSIINFIESQGTPSAPTTPQSFRSPCTSDDEANGSSASEPDCEPVSNEILRLRSLARKAK